VVNIWEGLVSEVYELLEGMQRHRATTRPRGNSRFGASIDGDPHAVI
jgi:hypothetical protein